MLKRIIEWSVANKLIVLLFTLAAAIGGVIAVRRTPLEALPDLSDVQVIVQANYNEQAPRIVEDQVTYPIAAEMLKVPGARTVRGYSFFGVSFVYIIFDDGTDLYWARSRVLEYLNGIRGKLPGNGDADARSRRDRSRLGLSVRARGHDGQARSRAAAKRSGLVSPLRADRGAGCLRSRERRRLREAVSGGHRSGEAARVRHSRHASHERHSIGEQ